MIFKKVENCKDTYEIDPDIKCNEVYMKLNAMSLRLLTISNDVHNMRLELDIPNRHIILLDRIELIMNQNAYIMQELASAWLQHTLKYNEDHVVWYLQELTKYKDGELIQAIYHAFSVLGERWIDNYLELNSINSVILSYAALEDLDDTLGVEMILYLGYKISEAMYITPAEDEQLKSILINLSERQIPFIMYSNTVADFRRD